MELTWDAYFQMIVNGFFFGIGIMVSFAALAFVLAMMASAILFFFRK